MRFTLAAVLLLAISGQPTARAQTPDRLPDLDVLFIERTPRYPGYALDYNIRGSEGVPVLVDNKTRKPLGPAQAKAVKRWPSPGQNVLFTAHVQNRGDASAPRYYYEWRVDGRLIGKGQTRDPQSPGVEITSRCDWKWQPGRHTVTFEVDPLCKVRDSCYANNARSDVTDAWSFIWAVDQVTYDAFNGTRNFLGTKSFEDWAQWHVDHMNRLFDLSPTPFDKDGSQIAGSKSPDWRPRIRCDRVVVVKDATKLWGCVFGPGVQPLDAGYDGAWGFGRREDCSQWAANIDWGLIHEWGHQLGLTDEYALDRPGFQNLVQDEKGDPLLIGRSSTMAGYMMHGHGPTTFSPECMAALITQQGRRRGYYGDYYYNIPERNVLQVLDSQGKPVAGAKIDFWQDSDGVFSGPPTFSGQTSRFGGFMLPNRPAPHITTDQGYTQRDNPFGKINVVGPGDVFFIRIQARDQTEYAWLDVTDFDLAFWAGHTGQATFVERTHIPPIGAPPAPARLKAATYRDSVRLTWQPVPGAVRYRVFDGAPDSYEYAPVQIVKDAESCTVKLGPGGLHRFVVTAADSAGRESAFSEPAGAMHFLKPWGIAITKDGRALVRDAAYGQAVLQKPNGSTVGLVGSVHYHFEGSYDLSVDPRGRILSAKWGDGYNPRQGFRVQNPDLSLAFDHLEDEGSGPGQVRKPMGIGADSRGNIFIADTGNDRVQEFAPDGKFLRIIGEGELSQPMKVAFDRQDRLYVADSVHNRIAVYSPQQDGSYKLEKSLGGVKEPVYVVVDDAGRVFVSTNREAGVIMFGADGKQAWKYTGAPSEPLSGPRGLALDGKGNLLIVDEATLRVLRIRIP